MHQHEDIQYQMMKMVRGNLIRSVFSTLNNDAAISKYHLNDLFTIVEKKVKNLSNGFQCVQQSNLGCHTHLFLKKTNE